MISSNPSISPHETNDQQKQCRTKPANDLLENEEAMKADAEEAQDHERDEGESQKVEARMATAVRDPGAPTAAERAEHNLHHANYRSWCPDCVRAKGTSAPHHHR